MRADIAFRDRAEHRIGQCVQGDVGIRMAREALAIGNADTAEPDGVAIGEGVHVIAGADPRLARQRRIQPLLGHGDILRRGELRIAALARNQTDRDPRPFRDAGVVGDGDAGLSRAPVRIEDRGETKALRRFRREQAFARHGVGNDVFRAALQRVGDRRGGKRGFSLVERIDDAVDQPMRGEGAHCIVNQHPVGRQASERLKPGENRFLPAGAAGDRRGESFEARQGLVIERAVVGMNDDGHGIDPRMRGKSFRRVPDYGLACDGPILLRYAAARAHTPSGRDNERDDTFGIGFWHGLLPSCLCIWTACRAWIGDFGWACNKTLAAPQSLTNMWAAIAMPIR